MDDLEVVHKSPWWRRNQGYLVLIIVLIFAVPGVLYNNKRQDDRTAAAAAKATAIQNAKFHQEESAAAKLVTDALATKQHQDELTSWHQRLGACQRNNLLRTRIEDLTVSVALFQQSLADSRRAASKLENDPALAEHDLAQAKKYEAQKAALKRTPQIDCKTKYPNPFPEKEKHQ